MSRRFSSSLKSIVFLASCAALVMLASSATEAAERLVFKNGHQLVVNSTRVEGDTIYAVLPDGSELGFPKSLVLEQQTGTNIRYHARTNVGWGGRGPSYMEMPEVQRELRRRGGKVVGQGSVSGNSSTPTTVGYSYKGSINAGQSKPLQDRERVTIWEARRRGVNVAAPIEVAPERRIDHRVGSKSEDAESGMIGLRQVDTSTLKAGQSEREN